MEAHKVLGKILNDLEESAGGLFLLEQLTSQVLNLGPVEEAHSSGSDCQGQCHGSEGPLVSDGDHVVKGLLNERPAAEYGLLIEAFLFPAM